jgi:hypothetical protein
MSCRRFALILGVVGSLLGSAVASRADVWRPVHSAMMDALSVQAAGHVQQSAQLLLPSGSSGLLSVGASGGLVAGAAPLSSGTSAVVFTRPAQGWATQTPAATLMNPDGFGLNNLAVSNGVVAAAMGSASPALIDVFQRPSAGWSGAISPSARLRAPGNASLFNPFFTGTAILAGVFLPTPAIDVFVRPSDGWRGTVAQSARLVGSKLKLARGMVHPDHWVVVGSRGGANVFAQPKSGWRGTIHPVGFLRTDRGLANFAAELSGRTALVGTEIFSEPRKGWVGVVRPSAHIRVAGLYGTMTAEAISQTAVAYSAYRLGFNHGCPCDATVWIAHRPAQGWHGTVTAHAVFGVTTQATPISIALEDHTLFAGADQSIRVLGF